MSAYDDLMRKIREDLDSGRITEKEAQFVRAWAAETVRVSMQKIIDRDGVKIKKGPG